MATALAARQLVPVNPFLAPAARPLVVGHRGVQVLHQENTLAGFRRAVTLGLDAIELDVRLTRDGRAIVFHDANAERMTGVRRAIADMTWDEVAELRIRDSLDVGRSTLLYERVERVPLLAEVLAVVGADLAINIELKPRWWGDELAAVVASELADAGLGTSVLVTSYDPRKLRDTSRVDPSLALGYCWNNLIGGWRIDRLLAGVPLVHAVGADHRLLGESVVRRLRNAGVTVGAHVLFPLDGRPTSPEELERVRELGLAWLESDDPVRLQQWLA
jgi:glycerophosphoryl diester phosphodiesterase